MQRKSDKEISQEETSRGGRHTCYISTWKLETNPSYSNEDEWSRKRHDEGGAVDTGVKQLRHFGRKESLRIDAKGGAPTIRYRRPPKKLRNQTPAQVSSTASLVRRIVHRAFSLILYQRLDLALVAVADRVPVVIHWSRDCVRVKYRCCQVTCSIFDPSQN